VFWYEVETNIILILARILSKLHQNNLIRIIIWDTAVISYRWRCFQPHFEIYYWECGKIKSKIPTAILASLSLVMMYTKINVVLYVCITTSKVVHPCVFIRIYHDIWVQTSMSPILLSASYFRTIEIKNVLLYKIPS